MDFAHANAKLGIELFVVTAPETFSAIVLKS